MKLYNIISTKNTFMDNHIHTIVFAHTIKTNLQDSIHWIELMNDVHHLTNLEQNYTSADGTLISYESRFATEDGKRGWVEYEIWVEDIDL